MVNIKEEKYKKALVVTTVASTLDQFCMSDISILQKSYEVYVAANFKFGNNTSKERINEFTSELKQKNIVINDFSMNRKPISKDNITAYKEIKRLIDKNSFDIIHCHTPVASLLVRLAARKSRKKGTKIVYTAHGFHFFNGAPLKNWIFFYPIEMWLSRYTDVLITLNKEDYRRANKLFKAKLIEYIPGIGIDSQRFSDIYVNKMSKRNEIGLPEQGLIILSIGELNKNKNHETVIRAIAKLENPNIFYLLCGQGVLEKYLKELIMELRLESQVKILGFRKDIDELCKVADIFVFPSYREGLSVALMEAMASGLAVVCSNIRGNIDLIEDEQGGILVQANDIDGFKTNIERLLLNQELRNRMAMFNKNKIKGFDKKNVRTKMKTIYSAIEKR